MELEINNIIELSSLKIHNIPTYYDSGYCDIDNKFYLQLELCDDDMEGFIKKNNTLTKYQLYSIMFELLYTLYEFRLIQFEHRDIKLANILYKIDNSPRNYIINDKIIIIDSLIHPIITDFNHSGFVKNKSQTLFRLMKINYILQDIKNLLKVFRKLTKAIAWTNCDSSKITLENDKIELIKYIDYIEINDDASSQFLNNCILILYNKFIKTL